MSVREVGSYIGYNRVTSTSQDSASGIWSLAAAERRMRTAAWPMPVVVDPDFASVALLLHMDGSNGSTTFTDSSSNSLSVTANGNAQISEAQSKFGGASGYFDGSGDYIATGTDAELTFGSGSFTIEFWIRPTGTQPANPRIMGNLSANAFAAGDWVLTQNLNYGLYAASYNGGATPVVSLGSSATNDVWTHVAIVRDGNDFEMFKDGVSVGTNTWSGSLDSGTRRFVVGSSGNTTESWKGYIDDLRITKGVARYTANFTPPTAPFPDSGPTPTPTPTDQDFASVSLLLHMDGSNASTTFADSSSNALTVTASGNAAISTTQSKFGGKSLYLDGVGDFVDVPLSAALQFDGDFTIEFWLYLVARDSNGASIFNNYNSFGSGSLALFAGHSAANTTKYQIACAGSFPAISSNSSIAYNQWDHFAVVRSGTTLTLYINGASEGTFTTSSAINGAGSVFRIGSAQDAPTQYETNGYIDEFRITKGVARYTANFTPPTAAFPDA